MLTHVLVLGSEVALDGLGDGLGLADAGV